MLAASAVAEAVTGLVLALAPDLFLTLLFGRVEEWGPRLPAARVAGIALVALGLACRPEASDVSSPRPALQAMLVYNGAVAAYFVYLARVGMVGILLWPALAEHAAVAVLLIVGWRRAGFHDAVGSRARVRV